MGKDKYSKPRLRRVFDIVFQNADRSNNGVSSNSSSIIFKSEHSTIKLKGNQEFFKKIVSLLNGNNTLEQIFASLYPYYKREDIGRFIDVLIQNNLIEEGAVDNLASNNPQLEFFKDLFVASGSVNIIADSAVKKLRESKVAIFGLGAHGAYVVSALANEGIGHIKCLDPTIVTDEDTYLSPAIYQKKDVANKRREDALFEYIQNNFPSTKLEISNLQKEDDNIKEEDIEKWVDDGNCDFAACCIDRGFLSIYNWLNKAALKKSLHWCAGSIEGVQAVIGPTIIPGETACYMCYQMWTASFREKSYDDSMAYYEYLDNNKKDELYRRSNIGISAGIVGNLIAIEVMKVLLGFRVSPLAGRIYVINFFNMTGKFHKILRRPDCPHCGFNQNNKSSLNEVRKKQLGFDIKKELFSFSEKDIQEEGDDNDDFDLVQFFHENSKRNLFYVDSELGIQKKPPPFKYPDSSCSIPLPRSTSGKGELDIKMSVDKAILDRRSCRDFVDKPISFEILSKILYYGYGITDRSIYPDNLKVFTRTCPSAGALYPYEIYPIVFNVSGIEKGIYHYSPITHSIELLKTGEFTNQAIHLFLGQSYIANSAVSIILSAVLKRTTWKYGSRGYRYLLIEAGHLAQNMCLVATAEGLGTLTLGAFDDNSLSHFIGTDPVYEPIVYGLFVGYKGTAE